MHYEEGLGARQMGGFSWVAEQLLAFFEGICFVDFCDGVDRREV